VGNFGRKAAVFRKPERVVFVQISPFQILEARKKLTHIWGYKTEQLSEFSTVRAAYPQFLGSYPQFGGWAV